MADKKTDKDLKKKVVKKDEKGNSPHIETEPVLDEETVISPALRRKRAITFKRHARKIALGRKKAEKRAPDKKRLEKRATRQAIKQVRGELAGDRGRNYGDLGPQEKSAIDKRVQSKKALVQRVAKRLLPKVKKAAAERRSGNQKQAQAHRVDEAFKSTPTKRPHELFSKDGKIKHDRRFKINRKIAEDLVDAARKKHDKEKDQLKDRQARELRNARIRRANNKFRKEDAEDLAKNILGEEYDIDKVMSVTESICSEEKVVKDGQKGAGEQGTDELTKKYVKDTPHMSIDEKIEDKDMGDVIKDFRDSDAPQFKGKSDEKKRKMAIAAKLAADRRKNK